MSNTSQRKNKLSKEQWCLHIYLKENNCCDKPIERLYIKGGLDTNIILVVSKTNCIKVRMQAHRATSWVSTGKHILCIYILKQMAFDGNNTVTVVDCGTSIVHLLAVKLLFNSIIWTSGANFIALYLKDLHLNTPTEHPGLLCMKLGNFLKHIFA